MAELLDSWRESAAVPPGWAPRASPGAITKRPVKNACVRALLQGLLPGRWRKVYHEGLDGTEVHYFQHDSGKVAFVKHKAT